MSLVHGVVGAGFNATSNLGQGPAGFRLGGQGDQITSNLMGRFYESAVRGTLFSVANQAAVSSTAGLATTFTGLAIANPSTSQKNLVIRRFMVAQAAAGVAGAVGIMVGSGAAAGSLTVRAAKVGGPISMTTASAGATIATPVLERVYGSIGSVATTGYGLMNGLVAEVDGDLIIPPGYYAASYTSAATTTALIFGFVWDEIPIGNL
jgi:hypothetical protein